jgi:hypothetical protein
MAGKTTRAQNLAMKTRKAGSAQKGKAKSVGARSAKAGEALQRTSRLKARSDELRENLAKTQAEFVVTEIATATTFATVALDAEDAEKRERNTQNARTGYDTAVRFGSDPKVDKKLNDGSSEQMSKLKELLRKLGEDV